MDAFDALAGPDLHSLDPSGGVLVVTTYWRPRSGDPNPEQPGEKLFEIANMRKMNVGTQSIASLRSLLLS